MAGERPKAITQLAKVWRKCLIFCTVIVSHRIGEGRFAAIIGNVGEIGEGDCRRQFRQIIIGSRSTVPYQKQTLESVHL